MSIKRNTLWNLVGAGSPILVAIFAIPFLLNQLGNEGFGILTLIWALIGYFTLFDFGIGRALTYELSRRAGADDQELSPYLKAGLVLTMSTGLLGGVVVAALADPISHAWLGINKSWHEDARLAFFIVAVGIVPTSLTSGFRGAFEGLNRFDISNINKVVVGALTFALPAWSVAVHGQQLWIASLYIVSVRFIFAFALIYQLKEFLFTKILCKKNHFYSLLNYGVWLSVSSVVGPLMVYGDRFLVSAILGVDLLPFYTIPQEMLGRILLIPLAFTSALLPKLAIMDLVDLKFIYIRYFKGIAIIMFVICTTVAFLAFPALQFWISDDFAATAIGTVLVLIVGVWFNSMASAPYTALNALGKTRLTAIIHVSELVAYIPLVWYFIYNYGIIGVAFAWAIRTLVDFALLSIFAALSLKNK